MAKTDTPAFDIFEKKFADYKREINGTSASSVVYQVLIQLNRYSPAEWEENREKIIERLIKVIVKLDVRDPSTFDKVIFPLFGVSVMERIGFLSHNSLNRINALADMIERLAPFVKSECLEGIFGKVLGTLRGNSRAGFAAFSDDEIFPAAELLFCKLSNLVKGGFKDTANLGPKDFDKNKARDILRIASTVDSWRELKETKF